MQLIFDDYFSTATCNKSIHSLIIHTSNQAIFYLRIFQFDFSLTQLSRNRVVSTLLITEIEGDFPRAEF